MIDYWNAKCNIVYIIKYISYIVLLLYTEGVLKVYCRCTEGVLPAHWRYTKGVLKVHWRYTEGVLKEYWNCSACALKEYWRCTEGVLKEGAVYKMLGLNSAIVYTMCFRAITIFNGTFCVPHFLVKFLGIAKQFLAGIHGYDERHFIKNTYMQCKVLYYGYLHSK